MTRFFLRWFLALSVMAAMFGAGQAFAQQEPSMNEIYATAQSGNLNQAQVMIQQVLVAHPNSAKAHFVAAELYARQGNTARARDALNSAEKLAPGLPFAKPEAVQALRNQLSGANRAIAAPVTAAPAAQSSSGSWLLPLMLAGGVIVVAYFVFRRRRPEVYVQAPAYNGLNGPQNFGAGGAVMQPGYGPQGYGQPMYPQQGGGIGSGIMGGVATGLAVGAGVVAAEAIGRSLMGDHGHDTPRTENYPSHYDAAPVNQDMGGQNFGIADSGSWDDGGAGGGGGDWDN